MDERELNKKLAEWAGFTYKFGGEWNYERYKSTNAWWESPKEDKFRDVPNFAQSLDACFQWLVPKFGNRVEVKFRHGYPYMDTLTCEVWRHPKENDGKNVMEEVYIPTTTSNPPDYFAVALCLATEKLIDVEVKAK